MTHAIRIEPLTRAAFAPFGIVIEPGAAAREFAINEGTARRYDAVARVDTDAAGHVSLSLVRAEPRALPFTIVLLERHPLGSQAFVPLDPSIRYLVVVATDPQSTPRAFVATHGQGVQYHRGCWHHPLITLDRTSEFLIVDRGGAGDNCDEAALPQSYVIA